MHSLRDRMASIVTGAAMRLAAYKVMGPADGVSSSTSGCLLAYGRSAWAIWSRKGVQTSRRYPVRLHYFMHFVSIYMYRVYPAHTVRSHTSTQPRIPSSLSQSTTISSHHSARRAQSQPRLNTSPSNYPKLASSASSSNLRDRERVPPVPRIPSAHSDISSVPQEHEQIRGRSRTSTSRSVGPLQTERPFSQQMPGEWQKENLRTAPPVVVARSGPQGPTDLEQPLPQLFLESSEHRPRSRTREGTLHKKRQDVPT